MKLFFVALVVGSLAHAVPNSETVKAAFESLPRCQNFVRFDDENLYLGFGPYKIKFEEPRNPIPSTFQIAPMAHPDQAVTLNTTDAAIDSIRYGRSLFILTYSGIEEWDMNSKQRLAKHDTYAISGPLAYKQHAQAFAQYGHIAIIAHGRLGVSFFDLGSKRLVNQFRLVQSQLPQESMAMGVTVVGKYAYVVMDNFTLSQGGQKPAFRGVIVIDLDRQTVVAQLDGMDPGADSIVGDAQRLIVSFLGNPLWKYNVTDMNSHALPAPRTSVSKFPIDGHPIGHAQMDDKYYFTCYSKAPPHGGAYKQVPMALERAPLGLN